MLFRSPKDLNPSGTSSQLELSEMVGELKAMGRKQIYDLVQSGKVQQIAERLMKQPKWAEYAANNPETFALAAAALASNLNRTDKPRERLSINQLEGPNQ